MSSFLVIHLPEGRNPATMIEHANTDGLSWSVCTSIDEMTVFANDFWEQSPSPNHYNSLTETRVKEEEYDPGELIVDNFQVKYRAAGTFGQGEADFASNGQNVDRCGIDFPMTSQITDLSSFSPLVSQPAAFRPSDDDLNDFEMSEEEEVAPKKPVSEEYERIGRRYYCAQRNRLPDPGDIFQSLTGGTPTFTWPPGLVIPRPRLPHEIRQDELAKEKREISAAVLNAIQKRPVDTSISSAPRNPVFQTAASKEEDVPAAVLDVIFQLRHGETSTSSAPENPAPLDEPPSSYMNSDDSEEEEESEDDPSSENSSGDEYIDSDWERKQERINKQLNKPPPRVYSCWVKACGDEFPTRPKLEEHFKTAHPGKKPYRCTECKKQFLSSHNFGDHMKIAHSDAEPTYKCPECDKAFHRSDNLKAHIRLHTGEFPYECKKCGKKFNNLPNYHVHLRVHTPKSIKPYKCKYCEAGYRHSPTLTHHIRKRHPEELEKAEDD